MIYLTLQNKSDIKIDTNDERILRDIRDQFTYYEEGFQFTYRYKANLWDGKTSLFKTSNRTLPYGLFFELFRFLKLQGLSKQLVIDDSIKNIFKATDNIDIKYDLKYEPFYYQDETIKDAIQKTRGLYQLPTSSGKSLIISYIINNLYNNKITKSNLIIVPTLSLIEQFRSDLIDYGIDESIIGRVNKDHKQFDAPIVISTWQSLKNNIEKLDRFDLAICDEVHLGKASSINKIMQKCSQHAKYVLGFTGTMPSKPLEKLKVQNYIGPVWKTYSSKKLSDEGYLSKCNIRQIKLKYLDSYTGDYNSIKRDIVQNDYRLKVIKSIANKMDFLLILVERVKDEGEVIAEYLKENIKDKEIIFLSGRDKALIREAWRKNMESNGNLIIIATYGIFSTGVNIKSLKNVLLISSSKSKIRILQSIGRSLRKHDNKKDEGATIWDLWDQVKNLRDHGRSRDRFYKNEEFDITAIEMNERKDKNLDKLYK